MQLLQTFDTVVNENNGESTFNACKYMPSYTANTMNQQNNSQWSTTFRPWCLRKSLVIYYRSLRDWRQFSVFQRIVGRCVSTVSCLLCGPACSHDQLLPPASDALEFFTDAIMPRQPLKSVLDISNDYSILYKKAAANSFFGRFSHRGEV